MPSVKVSINFSSQIWLKTLIGLYANFNDVIVIQNTRGIVKKISLIFEIIKNTTWTFTCYNVE